MTRESLAKDILIAFIPRWTEIVEGVPPTDNTLKAISANCVELADALLEALGTTEPPASWLSKEMQTPARGFPAVQALRIGDTVELPPDLPECGGLRLRGVLISFPKFGDSEVLLQIGNGPKQHINVPTYRLVRVPEPMGQGRMVG